MLLLSCNAGDSFGSHSTQVSYHLTQILSCIGTTQCCAELGLWVAQVAWQTQPTQGSVLYTSLYLSAAKRVHTFSVFSQLYLMQCPTLPSRPSIWSFTCWGLKTSSWCCSWTAQLKQWRAMEDCSTILYYKSLHRLAPPYLSDDCQLVTDTGRRHLRSADVHTCTVPWTQSRLGDRSFGVAGPRLWNSLPAELR